MMVIAMITAATSQATRLPPLRDVVTEYPDGRVGGNEVHHVDVRVIAATNVDLPALAEIGRFPQQSPRPAGPRRRHRPAVARAREHFGRGMTRELGREVFRGVHRGRFLGRVAACERKLLSEALAANHFNQPRTATALGLTYDQLRTTSRSTRWAR
jgi:DNA-binding NtrC family response regulator